MKYPNLPDLFETFLIVLVAFKVACRLTLCLRSSILLCNMSKLFKFRNPPRIVWDACNGSGLSDHFRTCWDFFGTWWSLFWASHSFLWASVTFACAHLYPCPRFSCHSKSGYCCSKRFKIKEHACLLLIDVGLVTGNFSQHICLLSEAKTFRGWNAIKAIRLLLHNKIYFRGGTKPFWVLFETWSIYFPLLSCLSPCLPSQVTRFAPV